MLTITVVASELYNEETEEFVPLDEVIVEFEHSLISLSKWESKFQKAFLGPEIKGKEEIFEYIKLMILNVVDSEIVNRLSQQNFNDIQAYIESAQSATTFGELPKTPTKGEVITAELIYYWLVAFNIPFEVEYWHLNRLFALIRICNIKQSKPKKISKAELARRNAELNARRRAESGSSG